MTVQPFLLTHLLTASLNHLIKKTAGIRQQLQNHPDKTVHFRIGTTLYHAITIRADGLVKPALGNETADVTLHIPVELAPRIVAGEMEAFQEVTSHGDTALAEILLCLGQTVHIEIGEILSRVLGNVLSCRAQSAGEAFIRWQLRSIHNLSSALAGFLTEEHPLATDKIRFDHAAGEINALQQHLSQLEERVHTLRSSVALPHKNLSVSAPASNAG